MLPIEQTEVIEIGFFAPGEPKPQPRPRAFARRFGAKTSARVFDPGTAEHWKGCVALAARGFVPKTPLMGPLAVSLCFIMPRPGGHFRTGKNAGQLKDWAPLYHTGSGDTDNLAKAVLDCLTGISLWRDDAEVSHLVVTKLYGEKPGCHIRVWRATIERADFITDERRTA